MQRFVPSTVPRYLEEFLRRLARVYPMESAARLAAQTFLAALPLLMVLAAFAPTGVKDLLADSFRAVLGEDSPTGPIEQTYQAEGAVADTMGVVGILVTVVSATALSRALQSVLERCWDLPHGRSRVTAWRWLVWLLGWTAVFLLQAKLRHGFGGGTAVGVPLSLIIAVLLWWWTGHLLLGARVGWAPLLPGAVLTGAGMTVYGYCAPLFMPRALDRSLEQYGTLGYVFTLLSWLIAANCVIVVCMALGRVIAAPGHGPRQPDADAAP